MTLRAASLTLLALSLAPAAAAGQEPGPNRPARPAPGAEPAGPSGPAADYFVGRGQNADGAGREDAQAENVVRRHPLGALLPVVSYESMPVSLFQGAPVSGGWEQEHSMVGALRFDSGVDVDVVADLVAQALDDDLRFEGRALQVVDGPALLLVAPEAVQDKARAVLDGLGQVLGARALVSVDVLTSTGRSLPFPEAALVDDARAGELVAQARSAGATHVRHELTVAPGTPSVSEQLRPIDVIGDYDVEIAQGSSVFDPIVTAVHVGQRVALHGSIVDGVLHVAGVVQTSELVGELTSRELDMAVLVGNEKNGTTHMPGPKSIQQAEVAQSAYALRGVVGGGRALVCASETMIGGERRSQLVVLRATDVRGSAFSKTAVGRAGRTLLVLDASALAISRMSLSDTGYDDFGGFLQGAAPYLSAELRHDVPDFVVDFLDYRFSVHREYGPWRMVLADPSWDRSRPEDLERFVAAWPAPEEGLSMLLELSASGRAEATPSRGLVPALPGLESAVLAGVSRSILWDYDVEVAQYSAVADPVVSQVFAGLGARAILDPADGGGDVRVEALGAVATGPPSVLEVEAKEFRYFDRQELDRLRISDRRTLGGDGAASFGATGQGGDSQVLQLRVQVR